MEPTKVKLKENNNINTNPLKNLMVIDSKMIGKSVMMPSNNNYSKNSVHNDGKKVDSKSIFGSNLISNHFQAKQPNNQNIFNSI